MPRPKRLPSTVDEYIKAVYEEKAKRAKARRSLLARFREMDRLMEAGRTPIRLEEPPAS